MKLFFGTFDMQVESCYRISSCLYRAGRLLKLVARVQLLIILLQRPRLNIAEMPFVHELEKRRDETPIILEWGKI